MLKQMRSVPEQADKLLTGQQTDLLAPKANMTRAEIALVIRRLLLQSGFID
ncbi:hypothetical protein H8B09_19615 [Paenibacillus sp. PR3]|uniref:SLH domain-containing protein n=1 Tax=Paenibacillus terricola TaxID=2763503 RepID=A0ABR8N2F8_9BACL|nr:hypothetical protein [Paenibacillus terricola]MBD3920984.1 hypothetical protein [Paenibacillus terricola]